jgi:hypothetical protein
VTLPNFHIKIRSWHTKFPELSFSARRSITTLEGEIFACIREYENKLAANYVVILEDKNQSEGGVSTH